MYHWHFDRLFIIAVKHFILNNVLQYVSKSTPNFFYAIDECSKCTITDVEMGGISKTFHRCIHLLLLLFDILSIKCWHAIKATLSELLHSLPSSLSITFGQNICVSLNFLSWPRICCYWTPTKIWLSRK